MGHGAHATPPSTRPVRTQRLPGRRLPSRRGTPRNVLPFCEQPPDRLRLVAPGEELLLSLVLSQR